MKSLKVAIVGARAITARICVKLCLKHPHIKSISLFGQNASPAYHQEFPEFKDILEQPILKWADNTEQFDVLFLCLPHTKSMLWMEQFIQDNPNAEQTIVIDLSADYRLQNEKDFQLAYQTPHINHHLQKKFAYGLSEWNQKNIQEKNWISNPGCFPTSILLPLLPILETVPTLPKQAIVIDSKTGISGAGRKASWATHAVRRADSVEPYKVGKHQHYYEISQLCQQKQPHVDFTFVPHIVPLDYGMLSTIYIPKDWITFNDATTIYENYYKKSPWIRLRADNPIDTSFVKGTNYCDIAWFEAPNHLIVISALDNCLKGASGQAIQNLNLHFKWNQTIGLL